MTKEPLEELIKQGATIYYAYENGCVKTIDLSYGISKFKIGRNYVERKIIGTGFTERYIINKLFETREQAEWFLKTTAERTERFEPPMWKDLLEKDLYAFTFVKDGEVYDFICNIYLDKVDIRLEQRLVGYSSKPVTTCQFDDATKENYEKACEIVRRLFKGERNDYH